MSNLDNELLRQDQRTANAFTGSSYDDVLAFYEDRGLDTNPFDETRITSIDTALEGLTQNEDGMYFNDEGQRVYVYRDSSELGDDSNGFKGENLVMRTEAEIREAWEADEGMGYFKEANPQMDVDSYMAFIAEKDAMYASGVFDINPGDDLYNIGHKGRGPNADAINAVLAEEKANVQAAEAEANATLNDKYGIQTSFTNDDGDRFEFNGATYTKTYKVDDHLGVGDYVKMGAGALMSIYAGPMIAGSLGGIMGPAAAKAASAGIMSLANQFVQGQSMSLTDAITAAGTQYLGGQVWDKVSGTVLDGVGRAEKLQGITQGLEAAGKTPEQIAQIFAQRGIDPNGPGALSDLLDSLGDLAGAAGGSTDGIVQAILNGGKIDNNGNETYGGSTNPSTSGGDGEVPDYTFEPGITSPTFPTPPPSTTGGGATGGGSEGGSEEGAEGGEGTDGTPAAGGGGEPTAGGQYEVVKQNPDGTYTVKDNVDGDVWIVKGDYTIGDYIPESEMATNTVGQGTAGSESGTTNTTGDDSDGSWVDGVWVPTVPTTSTPPATTPAPTPNTTPGSASGSGTSGGSGGTAGTGGTGGAGEGTDGDGSGEGTDGDGSGEGGDGDGSGDSGGNGGGGAGTVAGAVAGAIFGTAPGSGTGSGSGDGNGDGDGDGFGNGDGDGMMAGGGTYTPSWGELFGYTTLTPYQKRQLEPMKDAIAEAKGMLA